MKHDCDVVIIMRNRHGDGDTLNVYGTAGAGVNFIGNKSSIEASEGGRMAMQLFNRSITGILDRQFQDGGQSRLHALRNNSRILAVQLVDS